MSIEINGCVTNDNSTWKENRIAELEEQIEQLRKEIKGLKHLLATVVRDVHPYDIDSRLRQRIFEAIKGTKEDKTKDPYDYLKTQGIPSAIPTRYNKENEQ